jgi:hypothetical protein
MLDQLTPKEQHALLELLLVLAKSDGQIQEAEEEILAMYADLVDVDPGTLQGDTPLEELVAVFESPASRVIALQELFRLSHLDGWFADNEQSTLLEVGAMMQVPMELMQKIERWVLEGLDWVNRGDDLLDEAEERMG